MELRASLCHSPKIVASGAKNVFGQQRDFGQPSLLDTAVGMGDKRKHVITIM
jgi:hypothetical protein